MVSENNSNKVTNPLKYTCLFGGGAVRGMAYIGAIRALEELNVEFDIIAGSSVGAIFATLVACGYKSYELENIFMKVNFDLFKDIHLGIGKPFAISRGEIFVDWLNELISRKFPDKKKAKLSFEDLEKELVIFSTDLKKFENYEFSKNNSKYFEIARAIRISSSMPGLMPPYEYNGRSLVDGDLQKGSPMWNSSETLKNTKSRILEFRLEGDYGKAEKNPISFINTIYSCVTGIATDFMVSLFGQNDRYDIININTGDIFFADLNLNEEGRKKLIDIGYNVTMDYFKNTLPPKKECLQKIYSQVLKFLK
ncbi:MAG: patatin-like phospholipase family protein, partial [bacterium]|nr:patatin-like phospholipase family protein [bacterium]